MVCRRGARRAPQLSSGRAHAGRIDRGHAVARRTRQGVARAEAVGPVRAGVVWAGGADRIRCRAAGVSRPLWRGRADPGAVRDRQPALCRDAHAGLRRVHGQGRDEANAARDRYSAAAICGRRRAPPAGCPRPNRCEPLLSDIGFPCIVKPVHLGSSIGVGKADSIEDVRALLPTIFRLDPAGGHRTVRAEPRRIQSSGDADRRRGSHIGDRTAETRRGAARFPAEIPVRRRRQERHERRRQRTARACCR